MVVLAFCIQITNMITISDMACRFSSDLTNISPTSKEQRGRGGERGGGREGEREDREKREERREKQRERERSA